MRDAKLPEEFQAQWIWKTDDPDDIDDYAFFRSEFTLSETPGSAELWITARTLFHLFVNGRHICYGPSPAVGNQSYLSYLDVGYCLETGTNVIAVIVHNTTIPRSIHNKQPGGLWCQLSLDGALSLTTDQNWLVFTGQCYRPGQPRVSRTSGFIESLDFRKYPHGWIEIDYESPDWAPVANITPIDQNAETFAVAPDFQPTSEKFPFDNLVCRGKILHDKATTHVHFGNAFKGKRAIGLYAAETFVQVADDQDDILVYLFSDDPYYFFVNGRLVKKQGVEQHSNWADPSWNRPRCYQQAGISEVDGVFSLKKGWNRLVFFQQIDLHSGGATFVFPEIEEGDIKLVKGMTSFGLPGWNVAGPLRMPFSTVESTISFADFPKVSYYAIHPCDESAHLLSYSYETNEHLNEPVDFVELEADQYAVFDLENYQRGVLDVVITGKSGDTVDIVYGEYMQGNIVSPFDQGTRRVYPLILAEGSVNWRAVSPQGVKYVMFVVRSASDKVVFQEISLRTMSLSFKNLNSFSCSDELLNQIWDNGVTTLDATYDNIFLSGGGYQEGQLLADAMIQGISSFFIYGQGELSEKSLREFAASQYATGEIPSMVPGELSVRYFDFSLLWPVWLQSHILYTGDNDLLKELLPNLNKLLAFFDGISSPDTGLIGNLTPPYDNPILIDYDVSIERKGISTGLNALYCHCLLKSEWLYNLAGKKDGAEACIEKASMVAKNLRELTWDKKKGLFADCWYDGNRSESFSMQSSVLALYGGVAEPDEYERIFNNLFFEYAPYQEVITDKDNENAYFKYFLLSMAFTIDLREWAMEYTRYYWGKMIQGGATTWWNKFCPDIEFGPDRAQSICHGYGVSPNYFLIREVAGLRPADPGFSRVYFNPLLTTCEWVKIKVHTPQGGIKVEWSHLESGELEIVIESDFPLEVIPQLDPEIAQNPVIHIDDEVITILESDSVQTS